VSAGASSTAHAGPRRVRIPRRLRRRLVAHAREDAPLECCGLLIGTAAGISALVPARNLRASRTRYLIDPRDHLAAIREARAAGLEVIGAYHSHPATAPVPSAVDRADAIGGNFIYLIVSLRRPRAEIRAYALAGGNFAPVPLVTVP
jgi:proteasome lid subunit RPN8/RPN11